MMILMVIMTLAIVSNGMSDRSIVFVTLLLEQ